MPNFTQPKGYKCKLQMVTNGRRKEKGTTYTFKVLPCREAFIVDADIELVL